MRMMKLAAVFGIFCLGALAHDHKGEHAHEMGEETTDPFGNRVTVVVDAPAPNDMGDAWDEPESPYFRGFEVEEEDSKLYPALKAGVVTINVYVVADIFYIMANPNWQDRIYQIVETADNAYYRDHLINWKIQGYYLWTSFGTNNVEILEDLARQYSFLDNGLVMGFTNHPAFTAGGIAYVYGSNPGLGFSVCADQSVTSTTYALRHEAGHNYSCGHDTGTEVCLMNYTYAYSVDYFDSDHDSEVYSHRNWFK